MYWTDDLVKAFCRIYSNGSSRYGRTMDEKMVVFKEDIKSGEYQKELWLNERIFVDIYGREYNLSDTPMTYMSRRMSFEKKEFSENNIKDAWENKLKQMIGGAIKMGMLAIGNGEKCPYCDIIITKDIDTLDHLMDKHQDEAIEALFGNKSEEIG